jgi:hypothetical protein
LVFVFFNTKHEVVEHLKLHVVLKKGGRTPVVCGAVVASGAEEVCLLRVCARKHRANQPTKASQHSTGAARLRWQRFFLGWFFFFFFF